LSKMAISRPGMRRPGRRKPSSTGDVFSVTASDDGEIIAFTRGSWVGDVFDGTNNSLVGNEPRRRKPARTGFRAGFAPAHPARGPGIIQLYRMSWIPGTHQLIFSGYRIHRPGGRALPCRSARACTWLTRIKAPSPSWLKPRKTCTFYHPLMERSSRSCHPAAWVLSIQTAATGGGMFSRTQKWGLPGPLFPVGPGLRIRARL
jgi:hypothetical protein